MPHGLRISIGQHSDKGRKALNQDFHGALIPDEPALGLKGVAVALADGISSSNVSQIASESAIKSFPTDYYCTSEAWSVKTSVQRVLAAANSWLYAQSRRSQYSYDQDKGYVCTFAALVVKSTTAHVFHVGDSRIYRASGHALEQLTEDHRIAVSSEQSYLGRALGINAQVEIDYRSMQVEPGDIFILTTDGVHEHVSPRFVTATIADNADDLDKAASVIVREAYANGSTDNLTIQILRIDALPAGEADELLGYAVELPLPPLPEARAAFDGYRIIREIHGSSRSHIYLATEEESGERVVLKIPSIDLRNDPAYLRRFAMEEWVARRIDSPHVLKPRMQSRKRNFLYIVMEFVEGQTLAQWMIDNPSPDLEMVRDIVEQTVRGLNAFHRKEMLHQDLRPENIMIDRTGTVKIIDFGSTRVAGVIEASPPAPEDILGTVQYTAPEYFIGENGTQRSDLFSLGVIAYQMLTGRLPYGAQAARARTRAQSLRLRYAPARDDTHDIPSWIDGALKKAVHPDPLKRHDELSEFAYELRHPNPAYSGTAAPGLIDRNPLMFWKLACLFLLLIAVFLFYRLQSGMH